MGALTPDPQERQKAMQRLYPSKSDKDPLDLEVKPGGVMQNNPIIPTIC